MKHFLITRFNVPDKTVLVDKGGEKILDDEWLSHRFELFEKICLPSVVNQSSLDFCWLLYFDTNTPDDFKKRIDHYSQQFKFFQPVFIEDMGELLSSIKLVIQNHLTSEDDFVLTTRMDNDDFIHVDFIRTIRSLASSTHNHLIDLTRGFQINASEKINAISKKFNPFISLEERVDDIKTVMGNKHGAWRGIVSKRSVFKEKAMWGQVIHEKNLHNRFQRNLFIRNKIDLADFAFSQFPKIGK